MGCVLVLLTQKRKAFMEKTLLQVQDNRIKTSKYTIFTFLPINLFEQSQRVANVYFTVLLILQLIPAISSLSWFTTVVPLVLVLTVTAVKDATDDYFRHRSDQQVNNRQSHILIGGSFQPEKWMNVRVGDIIKLENNQPVAADVLLLCSSEPHGLCYVETAELDGETNLKVRRALTVTSDLGDSSRIADFDGEVKCEPPNNKLDKFVGTLIWGDNNYPLDNDRMLLRGCVLRNTEWCLGLVIFTGSDTKLMQNSGRTKLKRTSVEKFMDTLVIWIFVFLACMGLILAIGNTVWQNSTGTSFQVFLQSPDEIHENAIFSGFLSFWSYVIVLNTVVPISLYVSVEVLRLGHSYFINWDAQMYHGETNTAAAARTTTLNEELGQVEYVFSDKTGTLTQNVMVFSKCSINGQIYAVREEDPEVQEFFRLLALCHTVMSEEKSEGHLVYQAQSPDEGALVTMARNFGFVFWARTPESITLSEMGRVVHYQLLAILDFDNVRKRMSVIARNEQGLVKLYCKGADTVIFECLDPTNEELMFTTTDHLNEFAAEGLRTLALAYKDLEEDDFTVWMEKFQTANTEIENHEEKLAILYEEIEQNLKLLGATAIEDKLQAGVPETITCLNRTDIKIWVLTGDKLETAVNVGYSCKLLRGDMNEVFVISGATQMEVQQQLRRAGEQITGVTPLGAEKTDDNEVIIGEFALVITGQCLALALHPEVEQLLLGVSCLCKTVICCRVTPLQKAQVVELVKKHKRAVTLAVGDGANDVSMIQTAHIGVGISGQEGMQAVLASDYSIAQFRYLRRLLLVHGRWSYFRVCNFLYYFFYKNFAFTLVHLWYGFFCGFSAQTVYDQWFITLFNVVYTSMPVLATGLFDQDVSDGNGLRNPALYKPGQLALFFNKRQFCVCLLQGTGSSLLLFFIPYGAFCLMVREDGSPLSDQQTFAITIATALVIVVNVQIALDTHYWTAVNHVFIWGSLTIYFALLFAMQCDGIFGIFTRAARNSLSEVSVWLVILLTSVACVVPGLTVSFLRVNVYPTLCDTVRHRQQSRGTSESQEQNQRSMSRSSSHRSAYAFSHQQGYGELITSGTNMKRGTSDASMSIENMLKHTNKVGCSGAGL
ncbi:phospholipid-transporting ATPase ID [Neosynchiropus ocellatus]